LRPVPPWLSWRPPIGRGRRPAFVVWGAQDTLLYNEPFRASVEISTAETFGRPLEVAAGYLAEDLAQLMRDAPSAKDGGSRSAHRRSRARPSIQVETIEAVGLWPTLVDANQLENALLNLCINSRDAMPNGGKITIETANKWIDDRTARERNLEPGQYITICVSDTGVGIDKATLERVFEPFFTTKPMGQGTGLGLSMVYGFARQSNGHARIYSEVDQGTMVCMYLPRFHGDEHVEPVHITVPEPARTSDTVVLVVDDEPTVRMLITDALGDLNYTCIEAVDGPSGLEVLQSDKRIDLLITDVGLPGGLNGRQVADAALALRPQLKVLFITGYAENAALNHGHIGPGMAVLTKPFAISELARRVERMLGRS
jgi:CheY-like chemotaxis protein